MKNIYISADIEGIWGNVNGAYTMPGVPEYEQYRRRMIDEVNIAAKALFKHGAQTILVNDGHGNMDNLLPEELDPRVRLVCSHGAFKAYGMMEGISADMDGVCLIGYHCRSNTPGIMAHTMWGAMIRKITLNGEEIGESGLNAHLAWHHGVPIILASGDSLLKKQLSDELRGSVHYVQTKEAIDSSTAICCSYDELMRQYDEQARLALSDQYAIYPEDRYVMDITFHRERNADFVSRMPQTMRVDPCTIRIEGSDYAKVYALMRFIIKICNAFA